MKINELSSDGANLRFQMEPQNDPTQDQTAILVDDIAASIALQNYQVFEERFQKTTQEISKRNIEIDKRLDRLRYRYFRNKTDYKQFRKNYKINSLSESNEIRHQKIDQRNGEANYTLPKTFDTHQKIDKKVYQRAFLGGVGSGCMSAIVAAFFLGFMGILVVFCAAGILGAISGWLLSKNDK